MPAIHLSRYQVADLFTDVTGAKQEVDIQKLVKVARRELRRKFVEADMGVSGGNFAIAETGTIAVCTNEGNARLVTTLPRVHVALVGLDKLTTSFNDALKVLRALPKNATGQAITSYVSWISGPTECQSSANGKKEMHVVFLDNGRSKLARDPLFSQVLRCIRCGACANVCPVYRLVGGHQLGHVRTASRLVRLSRRAHARHGQCAHPRFFDGPGQKPAPAKGHSRRLRPLGHGSPTGDHRRSAAHHVRLLRLSR